MSRKIERFGSVEAFLTSMAGSTDKPDDADDGKRLLNREDAADMLGVSVATLRRLEDRRVLPPALIDKRGVHWHSVKLLREYKAKRARVRGTASEGFDGAVAAAAFAEFDRGATPAAVVVRLQLDPRVARELYREWADLGGSFVVGGQALTRIEELASMFDDGPVKDGNDLIRILDAVEGALCACCNRRTARFCSRCIVEQRAKIVKLAAAAISASNAGHATRTRNHIERRTIERARTRMTTTPRSVCERGAGDQREGSEAADEQEETGE